MGAPKGHKAYPGGGRPKGSKNKVTPEIRIVAQGYGLEALDVALAIMRDVKEDSGNRLAAANMVLNRAYGRPAQTTDINLSEIHIESLSDRQLFALLARIDGAMENAGLDGDREAEVDTIEQPARVRQ